MTNTTLIAWGSGGAALAVALFVWLPWFRGSIRYDVFAQQVLKLLKANNPDRARKLCKAGGFSPFAVACDAALAALADRRDEPEAETILRLREAYTTTLQRELTRAGRHAWLALVAAALAGLCGYVVLIEGAAPWAMALAGLAILVIVQARLLGLRIAVAGVSHREPLITAMTATLRSPPA